MCPPEVGIQSTGRAAPGQREAGRDTEKQKGPGGQRHVVSQQHLTQGLVSSLRGRVGGWLQAGPARGPRRPQGPAALPSSFSFTLPDPPEPLPPLSLILAFKCPATAVQFKAEVRSCRRFLSHQCITAAACCPGGLGRRLPRRKCQGLPVSTAMKPRAHTPYLCGQLKKTLQVSISCLL